MSRWDEFTDEELKAIKKGMQDLAGAPGVKGKVKADLYKETKEELEIRKVKEKAEPYMQHPYWWNDEELKGLAELHRDGTDSQKEWIENKLTDWNYHTESEELAEGNYGYFGLEDK
ncbi:MAG: hypothetical protein LUD51_07065 [Clostridia bacterium]|nr:hypothetical protein [Clostridia bacterium]